jgi:hypothetical protein
MKTSLSEAEKFDLVVRKMLSVPKEELQKRENEWKRSRKKRAKTSPASRVSSVED